MHIGKKPLILFATMACGVVQQSRYEWDADPDQQALFGQDRSWTRYGEERLEQVGGCSLYEGKGNGYAIIRSMTTDLLKESAQTFKFKEYSP